jgi:hypothetical protein
MTIRFAAPRPAAIRSSSVMVVRLRRKAANDNGNAPTTDHLLHDALKHFAVHGLGAAQQARLEAKRAWHEGRHQEYRHWLEICRRFDPRMARGLATRLEGNPGQHLG